MIFVFICLTYFTLYDNLQIHPCCCKWNYFILVFMAEYYSIIYMCHIFIHSSVDGHLGCFHVLATVNSAAMNIGVHVSFQISTTLIFSWLNSLPQVSSHSPNLLHIFTVTPEPYNNTAIRVSVPKQRFDYIISMLQKNNQWLSLNNTHTQFSVVYSVLCNLAPTYLSSLSSSTLHRIPYHKGHQTDGPLVENTVLLCPCDNKLGPERLKNLSKSYRHSKDSN